MDWSGWLANPTKLVYHGGPEPLREITDTGLFGGVFAGSREVAESHGNYINLIEIGSAMRNFDLKYEEDYAVVSDVIRRETPALSDDEVEIIFDALVDNNDEASDEVAALLHLDDLGEAGWELQRVRGAIAHELGYDAAEVRDEHGTSYLVLPGARIVEHYSVG